MCRHTRAFAYFFFFFSTGFLLLHVTVFAHRAVAAAAVIFRGICGNTMLSSGNNLKYCLYDLIASRAVNWDRICHLRVYRMKHIWAINERHRVSFSALSFSERLSPPPPFSFSFLLSFLLFLSFYSAARPFSHLVSRYFSSNVCLTRQKTETKSEVINEKEC